MAPIAFIHLPRTGGASLAAALVKLHGSSRTWRVKTTAIDADLARSIPAEAQVVYGHMNYGLHVHRTVRYATLLRDPAERIASHFRLRVEQASREGCAVPSLEAFLEMGRWQNVATRMLAGTYRVVRSSPAHLALAKRRLERFALVGFFDALEPFAAALGVQRSLPHKHRSPDAKPLRGEALELAKRAHALDFELYEWARERFSATAPIGLHGPDHAVGPSVPGPSPPLALMLFPLGAPGIERSLAQAYGERAIPVSSAGEVGPGLAAIVEPDTEVLFGEMSYGLHEHCSVHYATVLRDPVERALAIMRWAAQLGPAAQSRARVEAFLRRRGNHNEVTARLARTSPVTLTRADLETAKRRLDEFVWVGFADRIDRAAAALGISPPPAPERPTQGAWDELVPAVREANALDIELYAWARQRFG